MEKGGQVNQNKYWTASRKREVVLRLLRGESLDALSREMGVEVYLLEEWHVRALQGMEQGLKTPSANPVKQELDQAKKRLGELLMENELLQVKADKAAAFRLGRSGK